MSRRLTCAIAVAISFLPLGEPLLLGTLGITAATLLQQTPVLAEDASAVARIAKSITVRIEGAGSPGSGVLVEKDGNRYTVLTAWHVVSGNRPGEELAIFTPDGQEHQLEQGSIQRLGEVDMAVLTVSSSGAYEVASIGDIKKVKYDDPIYVAGFPLNNSQTLLFEPGEVVANAQVGIEQGYQLLYNNKTRPGVNGGLLLNSQGELVGIHGQGEADIKINKKEGYVIKAGVNQGIPISYYWQYKDGKGVAPKSSLIISFDDYLAQAKSLSFERGNEHELINLVSKALAIQASSLGYFYRGYAKDELGDYQGAISDLNKSIEIDDNNVYAFNIRGGSKLSLDDYQGALSDFTKAIEISDDSYYAPYANRGRVKVNLDNTEGAIDDLNKAIQINPTYDLLYEVRARIRYISTLTIPPSLRLTKLLKKVVDDYDVAISINAQNSNAYAGRGNAKKSLGDHEGAIADYTKAIELDSQSAYTYLNRGRLNSKLGDYQGALDDLNKAIDINPKDEYAYQQRGEIYMELEQYNSAIKDFSQIIQINPKSEFAYNMRGIARLYLKDYKAAFIDYGKAISINPANEYSYQRRASTSYALEDYKTALEDIDNAIRLDPSISVFYKLRGDIKIKLDDTEGAISDYNKAVELNKDND